MQIKLTVITIETTHASYHCWVSGRPLNQAVAYDIPQAVWAVFNYRMWFEV